MISRLTGSLNRLARWLYRSDADSRRMRLGPDRLLMTGLLALWCLAVAAAAIPLFARQFRTWGALKPEIAIPQAAWRLLQVESAEPCDGFSAVLARGCPADPTDRRLWESAITRGTTRYSELLGSGFGGGARAFWIGAEIPAQDLERAYAARAGHLVLGWLRGPHQIWLDGKLIVSGRKQDSEPIVIALPFERLRQAEPLRIAAFVDNSEGHIFPDMLNGSMGEGLFTNSGASAYQSYSAFWSKVEPMAFFLANLLVSLFFFSCWWTSAARPECFYMTLFTLSSALFRLRSADLLFLSLDVRTLFGISIGLTYCEAMWAMFLGLAFARFRRVFFQVGIPLALAVPLVAVALLPDTGSRVQFEALVARWIAPMFYGVGAAACFLQWHLLKTSERRSGYSPTRLRHLALCGGVLLFFATVGVFEKLAGGYFTASALDQPLLSSRAVFFIMILLLGRIVFREYKEQATLVENVPVSEYHRRPDLPTRLEGSVLSIDLKNSEVYYRHKAQHAEAEDLVAAWRSHIYACVLRHGGIVLLKKGDEVLSFFDRGKCENPLLSALQATEAMAEASELLYHQYQAQRILPEGADGFHFRGGISVGGIRPIWEKMGRAAREPYWEEAPPGNALVECARLMEFERKIDGVAGQSVVVVSEQDLAALGETERSQLLASLKGSLTRRDLEVRDKHGRAYRVAGYWAQPEKHARKLAEVIALDPRRRGAA